MAKLKILSDKQVIKQTNKLRKKILKKARKRIKGGLLSNGQALEFHLPTIDAEYDALRTKFQNAVDNMENVYKKEFGQHYNAAKKLLPTLETERDSLLLAFADVKQNQQAVGEGVEIIKEPMSLEGIKERLSKLTE